LFCVNFKFHSCSIFFLLNFYSFFIHFIILFFFNSNSMSSFIWSWKLLEFNIAMQKNKSPILFLKNTRALKVHNTNHSTWLQVFLQDGDCNVRFTRFEFRNFEFCGLGFGGLRVQIVGFCPFSEVGFIWQHISVWKNYTHLKIFQNNPKK